MSYLLFLIFTLLCCWLLTKIRFVVNAGLPARWMIFIFLLKIIAGIINGWLAAKTTYVADTWMYHNEGLKEYHLLFSDPKEYFLDFFRSTYPEGYSGLFQSTQSYWNDLRSNLVIKLLSIFDIFSFGNYYVNVILYNFIIFFGNVALFRVFSDIYKNNKLTLAITCFLLPSLLYFSSCVHKEGLVFAAIGIIMFNMYYSLNKNDFKLTRFIYILLALIFIFLQRNFILVAVLPALISWKMAFYFKKYSRLGVFAFMYLLSALFFFNLYRLSPKLDLPQKVVQRQTDFLDLPKAATDIDIHPLQPTFISFLKNAPQAMEHSLLRPYWKDIQLSKSLIPFVAENTLYELLLLLFIFFYFKKKDWKISDPFILSGLFFSLSVFLMIGYTIPVIGAIVRYRSIYLPFILSPLFCNIPWEFLKKSIQIKK